MILAIIKAVKTPRFWALTDYTGHLWRGQFFLRFVQQIRVQKIIDIFLLVILFRCTETFANEICFPKTPKEVPEFYLHI